MRVFYSSMKDEAISRMETVVFPGRIFVIQTPEEAERAVAYLSTFSCLGIDTETRPSFKKGETHHVALLQLSNEETCFLFRLNRFGMTPGLLRLLSDPGITKVGLSLKDDLVALRTRGVVNAKNFVDLQTYVDNFGIKDRGLKKIYANIFGERISKRQQRSNWEADVLTEQQQKYAAIDAWACLQIYNSLKNLSPSEYRIVEVDKQQNLNPTSKA